MDKEKNDLVTIQFITTKGFKEHLKKAAKSQDRLLSSYIRLTMRQKAKVDLNEPDYYKGKI